MSIHSGVVDFPAIGLEPAPLLAQWKAVMRCPACDSEAWAARAELPDRSCVFGSERIAYPGKGIAVVECDACGLYYKTPVPVPAFLSELYRRHAQAKWSSTHDFVLEAELLRRVSGRSRFDLLDVGAADGAFLAACGAAGITCRRSAFDVMRYAGIERHLSGEFMAGFLDAPLPEWSQEPYDVVTLFDVLEHLYEPRAALENLRTLLRVGGLVLIETGNSASFWPRHAGIGQWWYVRLLEHHVFWSRRSLERIAGTHGFRVVGWREVRHKSRRSRPPWKNAVGLLKTGLYVLTGARYATIAGWFGREGNQPWYPFARDHIWACLEKV
ncbi:MAG TPA: class I SAM-dependent methyltransferase [Burkholderiales bacterium]|nr:class I SAM-dependent methyltransferase [Burkholderiales bacterium]